MKFESTKEQGFFEIYVKKSRISLYLGKQANIKVCAPKVNNEVSWFLEALY